jgi:hypothetical protein
VVPVSGKVTLDNKPLTGGLVTYVPNASKGNNSKWGGSGTIKEDGSYELTSAGKRGAPPGHYKVTVQTMIPGGPASAVQISSRFNDLTTTPLEVEVKESPEAGAYELKVTR